jgi:hypothetical protein
VGAPPSTPSLLAANLLLCESVLTEDSGLRTAVRIVTHIRLAAGSDTAFFNSLTILTSLPGDHDQHVLKVQMKGEDASQWQVVTEAPDHHFVYGYKQDLRDPGGFSLQTKFAVNVQNLDLSKTFFVEAWLDGERVAHAPLRLLR